MAMTGFELASLRTANIEAGQMSGEIQALQLSLAGIMAQRNALRAAMAEAAPGHPALSKASQDQVFDEAVRQEGRDLRMRSAVVEEWLKTVG